MPPRIPVIAAALWFIARSAAGMDAVCGDVLSGEGVVVDRVVKLRGPAETRVALPGLGRGDLVQVIEHGGDVLGLLAESSGAVTSRFDSPVMRNGVQTASLDSGPLPAVLLLRSREHDRFEFEARVIVKRAAQTRPDCLARHRQIAMADRIYANARDRDDCAAKPPPNVDTNSFDAARKQYEAALEAWSTASSRPARARITLAVAALYYYDLYDWENSRVWSGRAAREYRAAGDDYGAARADAVLASAMLEVATSARAASRAATLPDDSHAKFEAARLVLSRLERFHRERKELYDAALQTNNLGLSHYYEAQFEEALPYFESARLAFLALGETPRAATALQNRALCEWGLGRLRLAISQFEKAWPGLSLEKHPDLFLQTSNNLALVSYSTGQYDRSLELFSRAMRSAEKKCWNYYRGWSYYGLGVNYYALGNRELAKQFLRSALSLATREADGRTHVQSLRALAVIAHEEGDYPTAQDNFQRALSAAAAQSSRAHITIRLASTQAALNKMAEARLALDELIANPTGGDLLVRADASLERARIVARDPQARAEALRDLQRAQSIYAATNSINGQYETHLEAARIRFASGERDEAERLLDGALRWSSEIEAQTANPEYRASLADTLRPARDLMLQLLHARYQGAIAGKRTGEARLLALKALGISDGARARTFGQILGRHYQPRSDPRTADLLKRRAELQEELADRRFYLSTREDRDLPSDPHVPRIRADIARKRLDLGLIETELEGKASVDARLAAIENRPLSVDPLSIGAHEAYLEYWVGESDVYAWVVTRRDLRWVRVAGSSEVGRASRELHAAMGDRAVSADVRLRKLEEVHRLILKPLWLDIRSAKHLVVVADGPLHVVPFAALQSSPEREPLILKTVVSFTPALRFAFARGEAPPKQRADGRTLVVADPVFQPDDDRWSGTGPGQQPMQRGERLERLPATAREAKAIADYLPVGKVDLLTGLDATLAQFLRRDLSNYRFIHVATHGKVDTVVPQLSYLAFGAYGRAGVESESQLRVGELLAHDLRAELVVLSACETSLGPEFAGEGPIGLRYAALARGASAVISSLWQVTDGITADLMTEMYGQIVDDKLRADEALAVAMRRLLGKKPGLDPAKWAPYTAYTLDR